MDLSLAVKKTLAYARYFRFPLSPEETHYWLISSSVVSEKSLTKYLIPLNKDKQKLKNRLIQNTKKKEIIAQRLINYLRFIPTVRLIALTGSVAINNTQKDDDIDLLIITSTNTLWLTRPFVLLLISFLFNRRHPGDNPAKTKNYFCPNLWLDMKSLSVPKTRRNIYTAHEVLQVRPLFDRGNTFSLFVKANSWTKHFLANAYLSLRKKTSFSQNKNNVLFAPANILAYLLQYLYMRSKITTESVSLHSAYFHKNDLSHTLSKLLDNKSL